MTTLTLLGALLAAQAASFGPLDTAPYLTLRCGSEPGVWVSWNTSVEALCGLAYGTSPLMPDTVWDASPRFFHHLSVAGFQPGSSCFYRVLPGGEMLSFTFPGSPGDAFAFAAYGDTRTDFAAHRAVVEAMAGEDFEFFLHVGDLVETGDSTLDWEKFFEVECILAADRPVSPVQGNHEAPYWPFDTLFVLPGAEDWFSFDRGNCHIICLDTEADIWGTQRIWLENDLAAASADPGIEWMIAAFHRPPYSSGNHGCQRDVQQAWCPLFEQYGVDIVFSGHDHCYERSIPVNGVVYIVTGGGGAPLHPAGWSWWTACSESTFEFCLVQVDGGVMTVSAIRPDGTAFDSVTLVHSGIGDPAVRADCGLWVALVGNPSDGTAVITMGSSTAGPIRVDIHDISGRLADSFTTFCPAGGSIEEQWPGNPAVSTGPGFYVVTLEQDGESVSCGMVLLEE